MSIQKETVEAYFEGFRRSDHSAILALLTEDVAWDLPGFRHLRGKAEFDGEIENEDFEGSPSLAIDRMFEEDDVVIAVGEGEASRRDGQRFRFAFCDIFTFREALIARVESYLVPLP